jgi:hypothetical protein
MMKNILIAITLGVLMFLSSSVGGIDNKTTDEPMFTERGFPKILDDDKWVSQLVYDTLGACYQGTIRWIVLSNPTLLGQIPSPIAQRQMMEHCFCVMDKIRKENKVKDYKKKVIDPEWGGNLFMLKAMECVKKYETLPSFFMKMPNDNETKKVIPEESEDSKEELPSPKPKESEEDSTTIFQG